MAFRLYIVPAIGTGTQMDARRPKYFDSFNWAGMDYGFQPLYLVAADLSAANDTALVANADVYAFPFDLTPTLNQGQVSSASTAFETALIPAQWVNATLTWKSIARTVAGMFQFMQRLNFYWGNQVPIDSSAKLNTQWGSLPADLQQAILDTANSLGYTTINITSNTQVRAILKDMADQWGSKAFRLGTFYF